MRRRPFHLRHHGIDEIQDPPVGKRLPRLAQLPPPLLTKAKETGVLHPFLGIGHPHERETFRRGQIPRIAHREVEIPRRPRHQAAPGPAVKIRGKLEGIHVLDELLEQHHVHQRIHIQQFEKPLAEYVFLHQPLEPCKILADEIRRLGRQLFRPRPHDREGILSQAERRQAGRRTIMLQSPPSPFQAFRRIHPLQRPDVQPVGTFLDLLHRQVNAAVGELVEPVGGFPREHLHKFRPRRERDQRSRQFVCHPVADQRAVHAGGNQHEIVVRRESAEIESRWFLLFIQDVQTDRMLPVMRVHRTRPPVPHRHERQQRRRQIRKPVPPRTVKHPHQGRNSLLSRIGNRVPRNHDLQHRQRRFELPGKRRQLPLGKPERGHARGGQIRIAHRRNQPKDRQDRRAQRQQHPRTLARGSPAPPETHGSSLPATRFTVSTPGMPDSSLATASPGRSFFNRTS